MEMKKTKSKSVKSKKNKKKGTQIEKKERDFNKILNHINKIRFLDVDLHLVNEVLFSASVESMLSVGQQNSKALKGKIDQWADTVAKRIKE